MHMTSKQISLVERLSPEQKVMIAVPEKTSVAFFQCLASKYIPVLFEATGTEIGVHLADNETRLSQADAEQGKGMVQLAGALTLNYRKVKCLLDIDVATLSGKGRLIPVGDEEYARMMSPPEA